jgi:mannose-6-phosphate isomerase-like protein (cupin superfamily)
LSTAGDDLTGPLVLVLQATVAGPVAAAAATANKAPTRPTIASLETSPGTNPTSSFLTARSAAYQTRMIQAFLTADKGGAFRTDPALVARRPAVATPPLAELTVFAKPNDLAFKSPSLQTWFNDTAEGWLDDKPHLHTTSDEVFIVLDGTIVVSVEGEMVRIGPGEFCCFRAGLTHQIVAAEPLCAH